jgi:fermentation-respiration switch protein FrsA (DUF1100 family)
VEAGVHIGARFFLKDTASPNILFFHGNGEIASDYDQLGGLYNQLGINFLAADYRGYGHSSGSPGITSMMRDCHVILDFVSAWLRENGYSGPLVLKGRSLGSASVLELASAYPDITGGLIVESGFALTAPLLKLLGVDAEALGLSEEEHGLGNLEKIRRVQHPTLIIHAERDHIIAHAEGEMLYEASPAKDKHMLTIPGADHNDIFLRGLNEYVSEVKRLCHRAASGR